MLQTSAVRRHVITCFCKVSCKTVFPSRLLRCWSSPHSATPAGPALTLSGWDVSCLADISPIQTTANLLQLLRTLYIAFCTRSGCVCNETSWLYKTPDRFVRFANRPAPGQRDFQLAQRKRTQNFARFFVVIASLSAVNAAVAWRIFSGASALFAVAELSLLLCDRFYRGWLCICQILLHQFVLSRKIFLFISESSCACRSAFVGRSPFDDPAQTPCSGITRQKQKQ